MEAKDMMRESILSAMRGAKRTRDDLWAAHSASIQCRDDAASILLFDLIEAQAKIAAKLAEWAGLLGTEG